MTARTRNQVTLVDNADRDIGACDKLTAHREGRLHRAFSIFLVNDRGHWLLQQRAAHKYHCGGLWSNTCCSHPQPSEPLLVAASDRLLGEMGLTVDLEEVFTFTYRAELDNGLIENEIDHILVGTCNDNPTPNPDEVSDWKWVVPDALFEDMAQHPERYTPWFRRCARDVYSAKPMNPKE
jgi:isopentenyl-diphosphate delta-isomerase